MRQLNRTSRSLVRGLSWSAVVLVALPGASAVRAADVSLEQLRDSERGQLGVRGQVVAVRQQIDSILADFDRNGLTGGNDVKTLTQVRDLLTDMSDAQMAKVVELLQRARGTTDAAGVRGSAVQAYEMQKGIIEHFRELVAQTQRQQQVNLLSAWVARLAERQNTNFRGTVALAKETKGQPIEGWGGGSRDAGRVLEAEQGSIRDEAGQVVAQLQKLVSTNDTMHAKLGPALAKINGDKLSAKLTDAAVQLHGGGLFSAATGERAARDTLYALVQLIAVDDTAAQKLQRMIDDVDQSIARQEKLAGKLEANKPADPAVAEQEQADNVDRTNRTRKALEENAKAPDGAKPPAPDKATEALKKAEDAMQQARGQLNGAKPDQAKVPARAATDALQQAKAELQKQLAAAEAKANDAQGDANDPQTQLNETAQALQDVAQQVKDAQAQLDQDLKGRQEKIAKAVTDANKASPVPSPAAKEAQAAANKAAEQLAKNDLPAAAKSMDQAQAAMEKAANEPASNVPAKNDLAPAAKPEGAKADAPNPAQPPAGEKLAAPKPTGAAEAKQAMADLAKQQNDLKKALNEQLAQAAGQTPPQQAAAKLGDAAKALDKMQAAGQTPADAAKAMATAKGELAKAAQAAAAGNTPAAQQQAQAGADALAQAQAALAAAGAQVPAPGAPGQATAPPGQAGQGDEIGEAGNPDSTKETGRAAGTDGAKSNVARGNGKFVGLPERDRAALVQSRGEKYPAEYGTMVEQYFKNLSEGDGTEGGK